MELKKEGFTKKEEEFIRSLNALMVRHGVSLVSYPLVAPMFVSGAGDGVLLDTPDIYQFLLNEDLE